MAKMTKQEREAINAAWWAINSLCDRTNWSDAPAWKEALRLERQQAGTDEPHKTEWARSMICKAWLEGLEGSEKRARELFWIRPGYLQAFFLGVRHAVERRGDDYTGPMVEKAAQLCRAAIVAHDCYFSRSLEDV